MMRRLLKWVVTLALIAGGIAALVLKLRPEPPLVALQRVVRGSITELVSGVASGMIEPSRRVSVQAEAAARVKEVRVRRGDRVRAGDILVVLNDQDVRDQIRSLQASIPALDLRIRLARIRLAQLREEQARVKTLLARNVVAQAQYDTAKYNTDAASLDEETAVAALAQARVNLDVLRASLRKTVVRAPFDGVVLDMLTEVGAQAGSLTSLGSASAAATTSSSGSLGTATGSSTSLSSLSSLSTRQSAGLVDLADDREMVAYIDIDEMDYGKLAVGQKAILILDALNKRRIEGELVEIFPYVSRNADQNRSVRIKVRVPDQARTLVIAGMSVDVEVVTGRKEGVLVVPTPCLLTRDGGKVVLRLEGDHLREVPVTVGTSTWEQSAIESGLKEGDRVAVPSSETRLRDGQQVRVKPAPSGRETKDRHPAGTSFAPPRWHREGTLARRAGSGTDAR